ncbi:FAD-dependent oxidoreductase [Candidatus Micrarchaeota archaeon]|nr:FAD-dependent oxidoreductase [Candidatus Micrarchaeota archaeon]
MTDSVADGMDGNIGVLGGGISGLTFANLVGRAEVLEKEWTAGGLMRSVKEDGYTFDLGSHILFSRNKETLDFMLGLLGQNVITHRRNTKIFYKGIKVKYPFENGLGDLPKEEAMGCFNDYKTAYEKREKGELKAPQNFKEWMRYRFGKGITEKYLYPYNRKIWDYPPEKMDIFWVEGRVPQPPLDDVRKAAMGEESEGYTHQLNFHYPAKGGIQAVTDALAVKVGKRLKTGFEVKKVRREGAKWVVVGPETRVYDRLVTTMHINDFVRLYDGVPKEVREAAGKLKWNSIHLVMLGLGKAKLNDIHWAYIPDSDILPNRISFPSNFSPNAAPPGYSSVLAETTFAPGGEKAWMKPDEIVERTVEGLHRIGVLGRKDVSFTKLVTCRYAYVVYDLDYQENMKVIEAFAKTEGITLLGRFSEFRYYNSDRCIESAMEKAKLFY